jgi:monoamine oxidase
MFKKMLQVSSGAGRNMAAIEEPKVTPSGLPSPTPSERERIEPAPKPLTAKLPTFDDIYRRSACKSATTTAEYTILKVADMVNSEELHGLSPAARHSALMMALKAAGVAVEDMLQDAVQRQRVLNDSEETQLQRLQEFEAAKMRDNERLSNEMETICNQYRTRIAAALEEIEREREAFREWQEGKSREQRRIAEAAAACVSDEGGQSSNATVTHLLEKSMSRLRESA